MFKANKSGTNNSDLSDSEHIGLEEYVLFRYWLCFNVLKSLVFNPQYIKTCANIKVSWPHRTATLRERVTMIKMIVQSLYSSFFSSIGIDGFNNLNKHYCACVLFMALTELPVDFHRESITTAKSLWSRVIFNKKSNMFPAWIRLTYCENSNSFSASRRCFKAGEIEVSPVTAVHKANTALSSIYKVPFNDFSISIVFCM